MNDETWIEIVEAYRTLGLEPGASREEIKSAYWRLASEIHSDKGNEPDDEAMKALNNARDLVHKYFIQTQAEIKRHRPPVGTSRPLIPGRDYSPVPTGSGGTRTPPAPPEPDFYTPGSGIRTPRRPVAVSEPSGHSLAVIGSLILQAGWLYGAYFVANVTANGLGLRPGHDSSLTAWQGWVTSLKWDWTSGIYSSICAGAILLAYILAVAGNEGGMVLASIVAAPFMFGAIANAGMAIFGAIQYFTGFDMGARGLTGGALGGTAILAIGSAVYVGTCYVSLGLPEWVLD